MKKEQFNARKHSLKTVKRLLRMAQNAIVQQLPSSISQSLLL